MLKTGSPRRIHGSRRRSLGGLHCPSSALPLNVIASVSVAIQRPFPSFFVYFVCFAVKSFLLPVIAR